MTVAQVPQEKFHHRLPGNPPGSPPPVTGELNPHPLHCQIDKCIKQLDGKGLFGGPYVKDYLYDRKRRNCRPSTIRHNFSALMVFLSYLKEKDRTSLETLTRDDLSSFIEHEQDRGMQPNTVSTRLRLLYAFVRYLVDREVAHPDILKRKLRVKVPEALPRALDPEDVQQLLAVIEKPRDRALEEWLKLRDPAKERLFYGQGRLRLGYTAVRMRFAKYLDEAGLALKGYSLHCLRHTCATELLNAGMRLECLQQLLGHSSIEMTRRYARLTDNTRREEYFRAMARIEQGEAYGYHQRHLELPSVLEKTELLGPYH